jgi:hypothetical protein
MSLPVLKLRQSVTFPGNIVGGVGIETTKLHGTVTIDMQWNDFAIISAIPTSPTSNILTFDTATNSYVMVPSHLLGGATAGIADVVAPGNYSRAATGWVSADFLQAGSSAVLRTMQNKGRDLVSIKDFGAFGDGMADDTPAFNHALAYVFGLPQGGRIFFPPGKYRFNSALGLTFPASPFQLSLVGSGEDNTILYFPSGNGLTFVYTDAKQGFCAMDLSITTGATPGGTGLNLTHTVQSGSSSPQTELVRVTIRGDDGIQQTHYWGQCLLTVGISNVAMDMVALSGPNAVGGTGYNCTGLGGVAIPVSAAANVGGLVRLTVASTSTLSSGSFTRVSGVATGADGVWVITVIDGTHVDLVGSNGASLGTVTPGTMSGPPFYYGVVFNLQACAFNNFTSGFVYGDFLQGVTINQTNFDGCTVSISTPSQCVGTLAQLAITNCQFGIFGAGYLGIITQAPIIGLQICNCQFIVSPVDNVTAIWLENNAHFTLIGNIITTFAPTLGNTNGILIGSGGAKSIITGNIIRHYAIGILLDTPSNFNYVTGNAIQDCTVAIINNGTGNITTPNY